MSPHSSGCSQHTRCAGNGYAITPGNREYGSAPVPIPLISENAPAYASSSSYPASYGDDSSYDTEWRSQGAPAWLAYDLSRVPSVERRKVLVAWYNGSYEYDNTVITDYDYNCPRDYTVDVNAAPGGGKAPVSGWVTLVTVKGNTKHSRQHLVDMTGYNWIRFRATAVNGAAENMDISINMDVYDAAEGAADDWIFFGDSITAGGMNHDTIDGVPSLAQLVHARLPGRFPVFEDGGIPFLTSADGARLVPTWLALFPGRYVGLSYGTNDANGCDDPGSFYANYTRMVRAVLRARKVPVIPHIPWARTASVQQCGPKLNAQIDRLYATFPHVVHGPDLWRFFKSHQSLISNDNLHPTDRGYGAMRQQWAMKITAIL